MGELADCCLSSAKLMCTQMQLIRNGAHFQTRTHTCICDYHTRTHIFVLCIQFLLLAAAQLFLLNMKAHNNNNKLVAINLQRKTRVANLIVNCVGSCVSEQKAKVNNICTHTHSETKLGKCADVCCCVIMLRCRIYSEIIK